MSNKRIQKKRAKAEMLRDKCKLIAQIVVLREPGATRAEYLRMAKPLWKLDMDALFEISFFVMRQQFKRAFPFRDRLPRKLDTRPIVQWHPITSMEVK